MYQYKATQSPNLMKDDQTKVITKKTSPQFHRIVLRSADRDAGSSLSYAKFSNVKMPEGVNGNAVLVLESFVIQRDFAANAYPDPLEIHLPELLQMRSWSSTTKNVTDIIGVIPYNGFFQRDVTIDSAGIPILDHNFFRNNRLSVIISNPLNETGNPIRPNEVAYTDSGEFAWTMILNIICYDDSIPM